MAIDQPPSFMTLGTTASNPGGVNLRLGRYISCYPLMPAVCLVLAVACAALIVVDWRFVFGSGAAILWMVFQLFRAKMQFKHGDACTGAIVSTKPLLVAVHTDLSTGERPWPAIKVFRCSRGRLNIVEPKVGIKVPTVALYSGDPKNEHWEDFDPKPVSAATEDMSEIERVSQSFSKQDWNQLVAGLKRIPQPPKPGLYPLTA